MMHCNAIPALESVIDYFAGSCDRSLEFLFLGKLSNGCISWTVWDDRVEVRGGDGV